MLVEIGVGYNSLLMQESLFNNHIKYLNNTILCIHILVNSEIIFTFPTNKNIISLKDTIVNTYGGNTDAA